MPEPPRITEAEWEVMSVVWERAPIGAREVAEALRPRRGWSPKTVKTLLGRLVEKGALAFEEEGRRYLYSPRVSREEGLVEEGRSLLRRARGESLSPLLAHFLREADLSAEQVAELRRLLDEREAGR